MARKHRWTPGGYVYHVCNRGSRKGGLFDGYGDYDQFVTLLQRARGKNPMRIIAYCLLRTHIHLLLWPASDGDLSRFMHWLTSVHAMQWHQAHGSRGTGAVYQSRYVSVGIGDGRHYFTALRYVERNAVSANEVQRAHEWRWCSACAESPLIVDPGPYERPANWLELLNQSADGDPHAPGTL